MPIRNAVWASNRELDLHVLRGQSTPDLSANHLAFVQMNGDPIFARAYLNSPGGGDVTLTFRPLVKSTPAGDFLRGAGARVHRLTGVVVVEDPLPPLRLHNFIVVAEVVNTVDGVRYTLPIRIHIHEAVSHTWLTPNTLTIRPTSIGQLQDTGYRFSVRAQFDDGIVGDLTENHGVTWEPPTNVFAETGGIFLDAANLPGGSFPITATLPAALGGASATRQVQVAQPWSSPNFAQIVAGGGWPGTINPDVVPNFLIMGDGFTASDKGGFEQLAASIVQRFKTSKQTTPFDVLATSINFWHTFVPSDVRGISLLSEVYTSVQGGGGERRGFMVPNATPPPAAGPWSLDNLIFGAGLPLPSDLPSNSARTNQDIRDEWSVLYAPDPSPHAPDELVNQWRLLGNRSLVEEKDTPLGLAYGKPPRVAVPSDNQLIDFGPGRMTRSRLDAFLVTLQGITVEGEFIHDLSALWAQQGANKPTNYDYILIISASIADRAQNLDGYITFSVDERRYLRGLSTVPGSNAYQWEPPDIPRSISKLRSGRALHEIAHSYGLGDEYADVDIPFTGTAADLIEFSNLQAEGETHTNGNIDGDQIKWNWFRARKGALISGTVTSSGGNRWSVPVVLGHGLPFAIGDKVILRRRLYPHPLRKGPVETVTRSPGGEITVLEVAEPLTADRVTVVGAIDPDLSFGVGDVLYMPTIAPDSVRSNTYPFAEMVAKNIKEFITSNHRPLTPVPCDPAISRAHEQVPILDGVSLPICFSHKPTIVGLYHGGSHFACGIFHPAGTCMMHGEKYDSLQFCAVCRYIIVDIIDPFKHSHIDRLYDEFYPLR